MQHLRESSLIERFNTRQEEFAHGHVVLQLTLPRRADDLLDEDAFAADERLPYWADRWPSAKALARFLLDQPQVAGRAIELGCGVGLPSLVLKSRGCDVLATDYEPDALAFVRLNAQRNATALADLIPQIIAPRGRAIIADPGRRWLQHFQTLMPSAAVRIARSWCAPNRR